MNEAGSMINSLGFAKPPAETRVVVAMSGGVDSSVTAALLAEAGYEVIGITLQLYDHGAALEKPGACCAGQDIYDARRVAERLAIPHYVLDYESRFHDSVMQDFADAYLRGETPIPCVRCNQEVKFKDLLATARDLGAEALATGHYVRRVMGPGGAELHRGADLRRDQSYFLFATTAEQLDFLRFPLGDLPKERVRAEAARHGLDVAAKPDSQDICFVPDGAYARVVERLRPGALEAGEIRHLDGRQLGHHQGIVNYTVGQRRGLGLGGESEPLYVVRLDAARHRVIVGPRAALGRDRIFVKELNWLDGEAAMDGLGRAVEVKLRSVAEPAKARIDGTGQGRATLSLEEPQDGISPGQAAVVYDGTRLLGGGWISATELSTAVEASPEPLAAVT